MSLRATIPAVACPYFYPLKTQDSRTGAIPPRLPLGEPYAGECRAITPSLLPDEERMRSACRNGYARGRCEHFPPDAESDAVRFHVAQDSGEIIRIQYIFERECWPLRHGSFEYAVISRKFMGAGRDDILETQAAAFVESYLRRRE